MSPRHYLDLLLPAGWDIRRGEESTPRTPAPPPLLAGAALKVLHAGFRRHPGRYALALPDHDRRPFAALRVFAGDRDDLDSLVTRVEDSPVFRQFVRLGYPRRVPEPYAGPWTEYRRYRIPSRKSGRKPGDDLRERRIHRAAAARLPYFIMESRSTAQQFGLYVEIRPEADATREALPDSYGLSVATRPFSLPDLP